MKHLITALFIFLIIFAGVTCGKKTADLPDNPVNVKLEQALTKAMSACGPAHHEESLQWLKDIIVKGEEGNFSGGIYLTGYQNKPVFYIRMLTGSGEVTTYIFDCNGTAVRSNPEYDLFAFSLEPLKERLIYLNVSGDQLNLKPEVAVAKANSACGFTNPEESLLWLKDLIVRGEEDSKTMKYLGNYIGKIYLHDDQNFYIQMAMGSGGLPGRVFDCTGTTARSPNGDLVPFSAVQTGSKLIYSNFPPN